LPIASGKNSQGRIVPLTCIQRGNLSAIPLRKAKFEVKSQEGMGSFKKLSDA
jgi:hypothetical protein